MTFIRRYREAHWPEIRPLSHVTFAANEAYAFRQESREADSHKVRGEEPAAGQPAVCSLWRAMPCVLVALLLGTLSAGSFAGEPGATPADVRTEDVTRFFRVLDTANGRPSADALQRDYLDAGSDALKEFTAMRIGSMERLAEAIVKNPALYEHARSCAAAMSEIRERVVDALGKLEATLPMARFPPVTILVGRGNTGGVTTPAGVVIGLETLCNADWMQASVGDRFVHLIAHEFVHVQQHGAAVEMAEPTLLYQTLLEGGAEYVGELISGQVANAHLRAWTHGRECALESEFLADSDETDLSRWLYNGPGDDDRRGDLGYWVGYRIAHAYVARARDREKAIAELLDVRPETAVELFEASGWQPSCSEATLHDADTIHQINLEQMDWSSQSLVDT
ncbi:DUF2268 domain-containing putative Zn-dependent protease [Luteimonas arsenica]|uniref:DUF2268 domain-containing putative Zn-dependent protease n=1 Tax=Luteimonas arsenica TaxID=1586242 RepID=UPI001FB82772|nr:DUF2268 domain-containing putative Zn-dependent protease [Luteimonas arsenica]